MQCIALPSLALPSPCLALPCLATAYHTISYQTIPYHAIPNHTIPCHTIPYHTTYIHIIISLVPCLSLCISSVPGTLSLVQYSAPKLVQRPCRADATPLLLALPPCAATDATSAEPAVEPATVAADAAVTETAAENLNGDSAVDEDPEDFTESLTGEEHIALATIPPIKANLIRALALNGAFSGSELTQVPSCTMRHTVPNAWPAIP